MNSENMTLERCIFCGAVVPYTVADPLVVCDRCGDGAGTCAGI